MDLAGDMLKEIATLIQTELQLLRAEISEKLTFTAMSAALIGAGALLLMATIVLCSKPLSPVWLPMVFPGRSRFSSSPHTPCLGNRPRLGRL